MISEQKMDIEKSRKEYYRYLNQIYEEISEFLRSEDGAVNAQKLEMMFEKTASPYVYWVKENQSQSVQREMDPETRDTLLKSLQKKYQLIIQDGKYFINGTLSGEDFKRLNGNMKIAGYRYDSKDRAFVRDVKA